MFSGSGVVAGKITLSITCTTPLVDCIFTKLVIILLTRSLASVNVKLVASAVISPPKVGTAPL